MMKFDPVALTSLTLELGVVVLAFHRWLLKPLRDAIALETAHRRTADEQRDKLAVTDRTNLTTAVGRLEIIERLSERMSERIEASQGHTDRLEEQVKVLLAELREDRADQSNTRGDVRDRLTRIETLITERAERLTALEKLARGGTP